MICGSPNIWPLPTIKTSLSSKSLTFDSNQIQFDVKTKFADAKRLMLSAYDIFLFDLKHLEGKNIINNSVEKMANNQNDGDDVTEIKHSDMSINKNCDINKIVIKAEILNISDVFEHMDADESYELNITRKCFLFVAIFFFFCFNLILIIVFADVRDIVKVAIRAKSFFGARHGLSTLEQLIWFDDADESLRILSGAHIADEPKFR